jgi:hypothetical protein
LLVVVDVEDSVEDEGKQKESRYDAPKAAVVSCFI